MNDLAADELTCVWSVAAHLGEGPFWSASARALWFVDIKQRQVHCFHPATALQESWNAPDQPGFVLPMQGDTLVVGMPRRLCRFDPVDGSFTDLVAVESNLPRNRLNDGFVDAAGRLWFGSMDDAEEAPTGALYRWDGSGAPLRQDDGIIITNGPATSPDGTVLYHTDTLERTVYAFDLGSNGMLANKRVFVRIEDEAGYPDGMAVDADGRVWIALFGGWGIRCYAPSGKLLRFVRFPCANVTKLTFGDDDLRTIYATTARKGLDDAARLAQPLAGGLFAFRSDRPGLPQAEVAHG
ncbi:SMP-30/gluconolactonase/LRE family protein [Roseiterribacter gracilis]|uniref:Gluconolaconase n=1 Tax=Roseiterribacter gracilis TaxID=2812848 RepID=A0A8S8XGV1_9PROT|nr:gluconolaconase [Rhodospirillales bacterium TMPK1]